MHMANIIDYAARARGGMREINEVDALIFATLSYLPLGTVCSADFSCAAALPEAARRLAANPACKANDKRLLTAIAEGTRYASVRVCGFREVAEAAEQFAAAAFLSPGGALLAFRGTDGTLAGWKEDLDLSFSLEVPAQRDAACYASDASAALPGPLTLCGHSKGGNLAAYAALFSDEGTRARVRAAYNFDGPGFNERVAARRARTDAGRVRTFVPQGSVVGMLLLHSEPFAVVQSDGRGLLQHDPYTWRVLGGAFVPAERRTLGSRVADATIKEWLSGLSGPARRRAIDGLYEVIGAGGDERVDQLFDAQSLTAMLRAASALDGQTREAVDELLSELARATVAAAPGALLEGALAGAFARR